MSAEQNKAIVRRITEEIWNKGDFDLIDELIASHFVFHDPGVPMEVRGPDGYKQFVTIYRNAFPDVHLTIEDLIAEGDKVAYRWLATGTQKGDLPNIPATGKQISVAGMNIRHIEDGKVVEEHNIHDALGLMQQLGVIPEPSGSGE